MTATRTVVGEATLLLVFSASRAWAEQPAAEGVPPNVNKQLAPLGLLHGTWEGGYANFADDVKYFATHEFSWILDGQVLLEEFSNRNADGDVTHRGLIFYFSDPETKSLGCRHFSSLYFDSTGKLGKLDADGVTYEVDAVRPNGMRGYYKHRLGKDGAGFRKGFSKVSGDGSSLEMKFRVIAAPVRKDDMEAAEPSIPKALEEFGWLVGTWRADRGDAGSTESNTRWILDGQVLMTEWTKKDTRGKITEQGRDVYYLDAVRRQVAMWSITQTGIIGNAHLVESTPNGATWQIRVVWPDGGQGHYSKSMSKNGADALGISWSKISGTGPSSFGPNHFERQEVVTMKNSAATEGAKP